MRFYIASKLENHAEVRALADALIAEGHVHSYDWTKHGSVQREGDARIREVAIEEVRGVLSADVSIVVMPGGRGTHVEFGIALACALFRGQRVIIIADRDQLLDSEGRICAFYLHPAIEIVSTFSEVFSALAYGTREPVALPSEAAQIRAWARSPEFIGRIAHEAALSAARALPPETKDAPPDVVEPERKIARTPTPEVKPAPVAPEHVSPESPQFPEAVRALGEAEAAKVAKAGEPEPTKMPPGMDGEAGRADPREFEG